MHISSNMLGRRIDAFKGGYGVEILPFKSLQCSPHRGLNRHKIDHHAVAVELRGLQRGLHTPFVPVRRLHGAIRSPYGVLGMKSGFYSGFVQEKRPPVHL